MLDIGDVTIQGITYGRRTVAQLVTAEVIVGDLVAEQRVCDWLIKKLGYHLLNRTDAGGDLWCLHFTHTTMLADTEREDAVAFDGRYEVRGG